MARIAKIIKQVTKTRRHECGSGDPYSLLERVPISRALTEIMHYGNQSVSIFWLL